MSVSADQQHGRVEGRQRPSTRTRGTYEWTLITFATLFSVIAFWFVGSIFFKAIPAFRQQGFEIITGAGWNPGSGTTPSKYGLLTMIVGTFETSAIAIVFAVVIGTGTSLAINFFLPKSLRTLVATAVELLAAIPSVVFGIWGVLVVAPWILNTFGPWLSSLPGGTAVFGTSFDGKSLLLAGIVLAVMILPTYVAISREVIAAVPHELVEASLSLGATTWQTLWRMVIPTARIGLVGATSLALARAFGETVAVSLLAGGVVTTNYHLLAEGSSLAAFIANQFGEAQGSDQVPALFAAGVVLMVIAFAMSYLSTAMIARQRKAARL